MSKIPVFTPDVFQKDLESLLHIYVLPSIEDNPLVKGVIFDVFAQLNCVISSANGDEVNGRLVAAKINAFALTFESIYAGGGVFRNSYYSDETRALLAKLLEKIRTVKPSNGDAVFEIESRIPANFVNVSLVPTEKKLPEIVTGDVEDLINRVLLPSVRAFPDVASNVLFISANVDFVLSGLKSDTSEQRKTVLPRLFAMKACAECIASDVEHMSLNPENYVSAKEILDKMADKLSLVLGEVEC